MRVARFIDAGVRRVREFDPSDGSDILSANLAGTDVISCLVLPRPLPGLKSSQTIRGGQASCAMSAITASLVAWQWGGLTTGLGGCATGRPASDLLSLSQDSDVARKIEAWITVHADGLKELKAHQTSSPGIPDLVELELEAGATLSQSYGLGPPGLLKGVMPEGDEVVVVGQRDHALACFLHGAACLRHSSEPRPWMAGI